MTLGRIFVIAGAFASLGLFAAEKNVDSLPIERIARTNRVSFHREILPVLQANCLPCHNQTRAKGSLILETPNDMRKGGDSGAALVPGKPSESGVLQAAAHQLEDLVMPPQDNKVNARDLTSKELGLLSLWIEQGAKMEAAETAILNWRTFPTNWVSSFAVALTSDGDLAAVARGNRVFLYDTKTGELSGQLADPSLEGAAQRDWVSALAFSPDGEMLAAAGFREVRLWQRRPVTIQPTSEAAAWLEQARQTTNAVAEKFTGDPRLSRQVAAWEDELSLCRSELARAGALIKEAEASAKTNEETIKKVREKREGHVKTLAEKEKELKQQKETESAAAKERDELAAELTRAAGAAETANKGLEEARVLAKSAAEQDGAAQVAASAAQRLKTELDRLLATLPESASDATAKTREAAASAASEAAARAAQSTEARAKAEKAREELAARAFAAGERKAEVVRAQAELPPRKKQAEERFAAAQKSIKDLQPQVEKARIALEGSTQDVALAEKTVTRAAEARAEAKAADDAARKRISAAEAQLAETRSAIAAATALPVVASAATPDGRALLTVRSDGLANRWDLTSGVATATVVLPGGGPLALAAVGNHEFVAVFSNSVVKIDTTQEWVLQRAIGSAETSSLNPFLDRVNALAFNSAGQLLATGGGEPSRAGELKIWRVSDGELVRDLGGIHSDTVTAIAFSPRGEWLATGGADRFARITPLSGAGAQVNLEGHTHHVLDVAWLADGSTLATAGAEGVVKLWNPKTGERRKNVEGFEKEVTGLKALGTTNQFVAVSGSGQGRIFRADGEKVRDLPAAPAFLQALAVTRNGSLIAGAGDDGVLRFWDPATGKQSVSLAPK
jgi:WD40 repeat protein